MDPCLYVHFPWLALFLCSAISMFSSGHSLCLNFAGKTSFFRECFLKLSQWEFHSWNANSCVAETCAQIQMRIWIQRWIHRYGYRYIHGMWMWMGMGSMRRARYFAHQQTQAQTANLTIKYGNETPALTCKKVSSVRPSLPSICVSTLPLCSTPSPLVYCLICHCTLLVFAFIWHDSRGATLQFKYSTSTSTSPSALKFQMVRINKKWNYLLYSSALQLYFSTVAACK